MLLYFLPKEISSQGVLAAVGNHPLISMGLDRVEDQIYSICLKEDVESHQSVTDAVCRALEYPAGR